MLLIHALAYGFRNVVQGKLGCNHRWFGRDISLPRWIEFDHMMSIR